MIYVVLLSITLLSGSTNIISEKPIEGFPVLVHMPSGAKKEVTSGGKFSFSE